MSGVPVEVNDVHTCIQSRASELASTASDVVGVGRGLDEEHKGQSCDFQSQSSKLT